MTDSLSGVDPEQLKKLLRGVSTPQELRRLLETPGVDDKLINQFAEQVTAEALLGRLFGLMGTRFLPEKAGNGSGVVQWDIDMPDGRRSYHVVIGDGKAEAVPGPANSPKVTLSMSLPNLLRLCSGKLHGVTGVVTGKIKISGDLMFAAAMQSWFDY